MKPGSSFNAQSTEEVISRYRQLAEEILSQAANAPTKRYARYLVMAHEWEAMASELERRRKIRGSRRSRAKSS